MRPLVSILMASYNHARFVAEAVDSVLAQDYADWELIIADDASTDNTLQVLSKHNDPRIRVFTFQVNRQSHMRNFARQHAQGKYLAILNSDDMFLPGKLSAQVDYLESHAEVAAVFTRVDFIDEASNPLVGHWNVFDVPNRSRHEWLRHFFIFGNCLCLPSVLMQRQAFDEVGGFDPSLVQLSDFDLWVRFCLHWELWILPEMTTAMRVLPGVGNLSAPSVANSTRSLMERMRVNRHYLTADALDQATEIFPEFVAQLPEPTRDWKYYLVCQLAGGMRDYAMRMFAFQSLQQLVANDTSRGHLLQNHPRLMRQFFFAEGAAALRPGAEPRPWVIYLPDAGGNYSETRANCFWREFGHQTLCFSIPSPRVNGSLRVDPGDGPIAFVLRGMRLYDQQSGRQIWQLSADQPDSELRLDDQWRMEKCAGGWTLRTESCDPQIYLPRLPLDCVQGKWLDLEIDVARALIRNRAWRRIYARISRA